MQGLVPPVSCSHMHGNYPQPVSSEAGFFDSMKGGETYVGYLGIRCLCFSSYHWLLEVVCSFQAFVAQWSPRLVLAILALLRGQTIE